jgi:hypothetical protein
MNGDSVRVAEALMCRPENQKKSPSEGSREAGFAVLWATSEFFAKLPSSIRSDLCVFAKTSVSDTS